MTLMLDTLKREELYIQYHPKVLGYIVNRVGNRSDAEDLASTVFLKVFKNITAFDDKKSSLSTWIYTITRNTVIDYFRRDSSFSPISETEASSDNVEDHLLHNEMLEALAIALEKMAERERDIIVLHYYREKTLIEIADMMKISYSYAKVLHKKAIKELKATLF